MFVYRIRIALHSRFQNKHISVRRFLELSSSSSFLRDRLMPHLFPSSLLQLLEEWKNGTSRKANTFSSSLSPFLSSTVSLSLCVPDPSACYATSINFTPKGASRFSLEGIQSSNEMESRKWMEHTIWIDGWNGHTVDLDSKISLSSLSASQRNETFPTMYSCLLVYKISVEWIEWNWFGGFLILPLLLRMWTHGRIGNRKF